MNFAGACVRRAGARAVSLHRRWLGQTNLRGRPRRTPINQPGHDACIYRCFVSTGDRGSVGDDEDWIPPDGSPLAPRSGRTSSREHPLPSPNQLFNSPPDKAPHTSDSFAEVAEDEVEVIDLEATLSNASNQDLLRDESGASDVSPGLFDVGDMQQSDSDWKIILRQLRDEGETAMVQGLVEQYNLHSQLASLDDDGGGGEANRLISTVSVPSDEDAANEEDWEDDFEGLSQEEIIDELIESSSDLSQLEMEILEQEMDRFEAGEHDGIDYDLLEETDFSDNAAYRDFRTMVWEDYQEKQEAREKSKGAKKGKKMRGKGKEDPTPSTGGVVHSPETTNASTKAEFTSYPPDWKDYDSTAAFQRDFVEDDDSWVPPSSEEFIPSRSYEEESPEGSGLRELENDPANSIDWLQARRSRLGEDSDDSQSKLKATHMMTPEEADSFRHQNSQIPIIPHTLLTTEEISISLSAQGGTDIHIIDESKLGPMEGNGIGCKFMMLVTGRNASHIRVLADSIVRNLKARKLHERGVMGAMQGCEGGEDIFSTKRGRARAARKGIPSTTKKIDDEWIAVDCENVHVHILDETTRRCLNIEGLWDLSNPNSEGSRLRRVDLTDEDSMDDFVANNPIPDEYAAKVLNHGAVGSEKRIGAWTGAEAVPIFQKSKSFSEKWSGVSKTQRKKKRLRRGS